MKRSTFTVLTILVGAFSVQWNCSGSGSGGGGGGGLPTVTPTATPIPPGDDGTVVIGSTPGLCVPGDVARVDFVAQKTRFALKSDTATCSPAKDNRNEEYTLILYNTTGGAYTFRLDSNINEAPPATATSALSRAAFDGERPVLPPHSAFQWKTGVTATNQQAAEIARYRRLKDSLSSSRRNTRALPISSHRDLGVDDEAEFRVRCDASNPDVFCTTSAILRAQGTYINLFVDRDVPVDVIGNPDSMTSTQLDNIAAIFDGNIYPLATTLLGDTSDIDGDGRVNVVITPIVNNDLGVEAYQDSRNLVPFDPISNAGSNESENIFVFAPDSQGNYFGGGNGVTANEFVSKTLNAWIAFEFSHIISFNQHVLISDGSPEDDWIDDGIGAVIADLAGFSIWRKSVYIFLNAPQVDDLRIAEDLDISDNEGAEYLFMLYYLQSQVDTTLQDADGDGIDDDLLLLRNLMTSGATGVEGLEAGVDYTFDETVETEFQSIFKDWTIAIVTSGTHRADLQQSGVTALKYFFNQNPTGVFGTNILDTAPVLCGTPPRTVGSSRIGANGGALDFDQSGNPDVCANSVGLDLNLYNDEEGRLIENADEHTWSPGNTFFGWVDPFSAMYVRLGGLFADKQTVSIRGSSADIRGFLVRRSDVTYPHVYSESLFGSIDQHTEDLDLPGPNPYWTGQGYPVKLDFSSMESASAVGDYSPDFLTIVGRIDPPDEVYVCPEDTTQCVFTQVPDTDKYTFVVPDLGRGGEEGDIAVTVRRQFDEGSDVAALEPMLAVVSSKDVPYPYLPHPVRSAMVNGDTRQQYRWLASSLICGDGQTGDTVTNTSVLCQPQTNVDSSKIVSPSGLPVENTGLIVLDDASIWTSGILGGQCDSTYDSMSPSGVTPVGARVASLGEGYGASLEFGVTDFEISPSSLGGYSWSDTFMEKAYATGNAYPDIMFAREFLQSVTGYPSTDSAAMYDPRALNSSTLNCHIVVPILQGPDKAPDSPDDFISASEMRTPSSLAEQILTEMSRGRCTSGATDVSCTGGVLQGGFSYEGDRNTPGVLNGVMGTVNVGEYEDDDVFAIDGDSRDLDRTCTQRDVGNNMNTYTVRTGEGSLLVGNASSLEPHIRFQLNGSGLGTDDQKIYANPYPFGDDTVVLTPGKSYTIIVGGRDETVGNYEIRFRKINQGQRHIVSMQLQGSDETCDFLF